MSILRTRVSTHNAPTTAQPHAKSVMYLELNSEVLLFRIRVAMKATGCKRAILVGHNAHVDLGFLNAALRRTGNKRSPFHPFSVFDTVTLAGLCYGQTVLAKSMGAAGLAWNQAEAHSALYDAQRTAELFCLTVNRLRNYTPGDVVAPVLGAYFESAEELAEAAIEADVSSNDAS